MITQSPSLPLSFPVLPLQGGFFYGSQFAVASVNVTVTANQLYAVPLWVPATVYLSQMSLSVTANATGNVRMGLYRDSNGYPGALVSDAGTASTATTNAIRRIAPAAIVKLVPGIYWIASVFSGTPGMAGDVAGGLGVLGFATNTSHLPVIGITVAFSYAALPDPFTAGGSLSTATFPRMQVQL